MKFVIISLIAMSSFSASALSGKCRNAIYGSAANTLLNAALPVKDSTNLKLESINKLIGTKSSYIVGVSIEDGLTADVKVVLQKNCIVKKSTLIAD
ncbi:MAG: hypothetical protein ACOVP4_05995 [Bacteriovoracaceae bacterium]